MSQYSGGFVSPVPVICTLCFAAASRPRLALEWSPIQVLTTMAPVSCLPSVILREREYPYAALSGPGRVFDKRGQKSRDPVFKNRLF